MWITYFPTKFFNFFGRTEKQMQTDLNELLTKAKDLLKDETTKISYETWIKNLEIESADNGNIVLSTSTAFKRDAIESRYHDLLVNTFNFITNKECSVSIIAKEEIADQTMDRTTSTYCWNGLQRNVKP